MNHITIKERKGYEDISIKCDICIDYPMELTKTIGTKESGLPFRQRWFKCPICGYEKKIKGSGYYSEVATVKVIQKQVIESYKNEL